MGITVRAPSGMTTGTYAGNDAADRAIPHSLGSKPKLVLIASQSTTSIFMCQDMGATSAITAPGIERQGGIAAWTASNFYVGKATGYINTANSTGISYTWYAFK